MLFSICEEKKKKKKKRDKKEMSDNQEEVGSARDIHLHSKRSDCPRK